MKIRDLLLSDIQSFSRIQRECYSHDLLESEAAFITKLTESSEFCFMAEQGDRAMGYVIAVPWVFGEPLALDDTEFRVPPHADNLYIHDLAVSPEARGSGVANQLLSAVLDTADAQGYERMSLVAVQGAASYWERHGFEATTIDDRLRQELSEYGDDAQYMARISA